MGVEVVAPEDCPSEVRCDLMGAIPDHSRGRVEWVMVVRADRVVGTWGTMVRRVAPRKHGKRRMTCQTEIARDRAGKGPARDEEWDCAPDLVSPGSRARSGDMVAGEDVVVAGVAGVVVDEAGEVVDRVRTGLRHRSAPRGSNPCGPRSAP